MRSIPTMSNIHIYPPNICLHEILHSMDWFEGQKLQETMVFTIKLVGGSCIFSHHPILSNSMIHIVSSCFIKHILVGGFKHELYFPLHIWDVILPIDEVIFVRGVGQPPTSLLPM